ncbi:MAG: efflux transporter outer membrane subunit [Sphingomonadaceae bacterium]|nr:efflux transporter outer membrane subunit [Sphingomonadaceae bacterium]
MNPIRLLPLIMLSACAVGPTYRVPPPPSATTYTRAPAAAADQPLVDVQTVPAKWWEGFGSTTLNALVSEALRNSPTVDAAEAALRQSRALYRQQRALLFPNVALTPNYQTGRASAEVQSPLANNQLSYSLLTAGVTVGFNPDVFGGVRRGVEGARAQAEAAGYQRDAARATIAGNVVTTVIAIAGLDAQADALRQAIAAQQASVETARKQAAEGQIAAADIAAFEAQLASSRAQLAAIERARALAHNSLAVLIGRTPDQAPSGLPSLSQLRLPASLPLIAPSQLVETRPDIRAAAANLHAATAAVGVAVSARLPVFNLAANGGGASEVVGRLFRSENLFWSLVAGMSAPLFDAGGLKQGERAARAGLDVAKANYRQAVLTGLQNVADALEAIAADRGAELSATEARAAADRSLAAVQLQRREGAVGAVPLLAAQAADAAATQQLAAIHAARLADSAALFVALGGGTQTPAR